MTTEELMILNGGTPISQGGETAYDFGWRPSTPEQWAEVAGDPGDEEDVPEIQGNRIALWQYVAAINGGVQPPRNWQLSGSCVNGGGQNALMTRIAVEIAMLSKPEAFDIPFTLIAYGRSRYTAFGWNTEGSGSSGAQFAIELKNGGACGMKTPTVPQPHWCGPAFVYDYPTELKFSAIKNHPADLVNACKPYSCDWVAVTSADEAERRLRRGEPLTWCGSWGGQSEAPLRGNPGVLLMPHASKWEHQQSCDEVWHHPSLGRIFRIQNQWWSPGKDMKVEWVREGRGQRVNRIHQAGTAIPMHGMPTVGEPQGGYYVTEQDMDWQCRNGEVRALRHFKGYAGLLKSGNI